MKKQLIFEVEEGETPDCKSCKFSRLIELDYGDEYICENGLDDIFDCEKYDLSTLKLIGEYEEDTKI